MHTLREPLTVVLGAYLGVAFGTTQNSVYGDPDPWLRVVSLVLAILIFLWLVYISNQFHENSNDRSYFIRSSVARVALTLGSAVQFAVFGGILFFPQLCTFLLHANESYSQILVAYSPMLVLVSISVLTQTSIGDTK